MQIPRLFLEFEPRSLIRGWIYPLFLPLVHSGLLFVRRAYLDKNVDDSQDHRHHRIADEIAVGLPSKLEANATSHYAKDRQDPTIPDMYETNYPSALIFDIVSMV